MKKSSLHIQSTLLLKFNTGVALMYCLLFAQSILNAQISKTYVEEISVGKQVEILSNVPSSIGVNVSGTVTTNNTKNRYSLSGKNGDLRLNVLKDLLIETWDKAMVRQETKITVNSNDDNDAIRLLALMKIKLVNGPDGRIDIDCNLNIDLFKMKNGWFRSDDCTIQLESGENISINYLELETKLFIPKYANLNLKGNKHCIIRLGELDGDLDVEMKYAEIYGVSVNNLRASLRSCYNVIFESVENADISSSNSYVKIDKANIISIGSQSLNDACKLANPKYMRSNSAQSKYKFGQLNTLQISDSANDEIVINEVDNLIMKSSNFSNLEINKLRKSLIADVKNTDISIGNLDKDFSEINITNALSTIEISTDKASNYLLSLAKDNLIEGFDEAKFSLYADEGLNNVYRFGSKVSNSTITLNCDRCKFTIY